MNKQKLLKLAKILMKFAEVDTDKGKLIYEGELIVGTEVNVEDENGEVIAAPDGEYTIDDKVIVVLGGVVTEIKETVVVEPVEMEEETPTETPVKDEKDLKIEELEGLLKDRDAVIEELTAKIKDLEDKFNEKPVEEEVKLSAVAQVSTVKANGALKYFQD